MCLETIRTAPVQCCRNGHLICNVCITRAQICPTCRAPMGLSMSMKCVSHVANRLIDLLPHPCTNKDRGCTVEELLTTLTQHESECRFRDVRCPVGYCLETVPMSSLPTHISSPPHSCTTRNCDDLLSQVNMEFTVICFILSWMNGCCNLDPLPKKRNTGSAKSFYFLLI